MKQLYRIAIATALVFVSVYGVIYLLLVNDSCYHLSISQVMACTRHYDHDTHLAIIGFLPVYIGTIIFGTALTGIYLAKYLQKPFTRLSKTMFNLFK